MHRILLFLVSITLVLHAKFLTIESTIDEISTLSYETPKQNKIKIPKNTKLIIAAFEKSMAILVNEHLESQGNSYLRDNNAVFIADITSTPAIFRGIFILPKLKKYKHPIYLNYSKKLKGIIPNKQNMATILMIENSKIVKISFIATKEELKYEIEKE